MGQVIGDTGSKGERERGRATPYTPANVLATLDRLMGIDPTATFADFTGRPRFVLDDPDVITEL